MRTFISLMLVMLLSAVGLAAQRTEYEAATDGTAEVVFGPSKPNSRTKIVDGEVRADYTGTIKFYGKGGQERATPTAMGGTTVTVSSVGFAAADDVVYYDTSADTAYYRTVASTTLTEIVLSSVVSVTWAAGDQLYEITQQGQLDILADSAITYTDTLATGTFNDVVWVFSAVNTTGTFNDVVWVDAGTNTAPVLRTNTVYRPVTTFSLVQRTNSVDKPYVTTASAAAGVTSSGIKVDLDAGVFVTPTDSPLYIIVTATGGTSSNVTLNVTVDDL